MKDLIFAIEEVNRYNKMDFESFVNEYEEFSNQKIPEKLIKKWKYIGLNNIDFITCDYLCNYNLKTIYDL